MYLQTFGPNSNSVSYIAFLFTIHCESTFDYAWWASSLMCRVVCSPHNYKSNPVSHWWAGCVGTPRGQNTLLCISLAIPSYCHINYNITKRADGRKMSYCTILVLAGTSTANTFKPLLLQQFLLCSLFTWMVTFWLVCNIKGTATLIMSL